jgi:RNA polymerase sigma factor (sigma-70 family)
LARRLPTSVRQLRPLAVGQDPEGVPDEVLLEAFLSCWDEAAFEALMRRHGPMVLGVCRRILGNVHNAGDALQATFLVLVRRAGSIRPRALVRNWLYGVACRTALDARRAGAKRRAKEAEALARTHQPGEDRGDLRALLDEELQRLPAKYRAVIVLSDQEGKTRKEVARQLGWSEGTVAGAGGTGWWRPSPCRPRLSAGGRRRPWKCCCTRWCTIVTTR